MIEINNSVLRYISFIYIMNINENSDSVFNSIASKLGILFRNTYVKYQFKSSLC